MEHSNRLTVYVRCKPFNNSRSVIDIVDDRTIIFDPIDPENEPTHEYYYHGKKFKSIGSKKNKNSKYTFDRVFNDYSTNYKVYETVTKPMVKAAIDGLNCSVFAYGATGSGKTYTMLGTPSEPGVIYYTSKDLFGQLSLIAETDPLPAELKICYFEIYNEKIRDLLVFERKNFIECGFKRLRTTPERCRARQEFAKERDAYNLPVCEAPDGSALVIPDLSYHTPSNAEQLIELLESGNANRSQHPTDANADSSRSHAIFQIVLTRRTRRLTNNSHNNAQYQLQTSKMSLIDLAGSERASVAYRAGNDRSKNLQREGGNINKSLLALGNCINALADPRRGHKHIPYRNSKLTRLLRDSLGGKCMTAMIATVCQQFSHYDDTQNTLMYASRAMCIKLKPGRNCTDVAIQPKNYSVIIENQNTQIKKLQSQNDMLKMENEELKNEIDTLRAFHQKRSHQQTFIASTNKSNFLDESRYTQNLEHLYEERRIIRAEILNYESKFRKNKLKLEFKKLDEERLQKDDPIIGYDSYSEQSQAIKSQLSFFEQERRSLMDKERLNEMHIRDIIASMTTEFEMQGYGTPEEFDLIIEPYLCEKDRIQDLEDKKFSEQHAYDIAQENADRLMNTERLLIETVKVLAHIHNIAKGRGLSEPLEDKISQLYRRFEGKKSVIWKDDKFAMENERSNQPLSSIHDNFNLNFMTPFKNNNTLHSRRMSHNLVSLTNYTPEQSNTTFDASK